ncbi:APC family permease [Sporolactobacillus kofuensis]|uniref:APC family permease n=1 Tax=Sporolactobacillus kofuensis TaxID=269672 RepID=A0ABW1WEF1_9BACL|nr:APC family permease [Sporolactobacillus kofuensis]MCO7174814.1 APC family permease [Sporolactobacillus kofuensis]
MEKKGNGLVRSIGTLQATAINMSQMMGAGPFITIPIILTVMGGPQAMFGWLIGAVLALLDGLVWSELGSALPGEGGTYIYLREAFKYRTGKLMPFLFIWSALIATPMTMSTGAIGLANYVSYFFPHITPLETKFVAVGVTLLTVILLYRRINSVAKISTILWAGMILTVVLVIGTAIMHFNPSLAFDFPKDAFKPASFFAGLGAGMLLSIYDYLGYFTSSYLGDEIKDPGRTIPRVITLSIVLVAVIDLSMNIGIIGVIPWQEAMKSSNIGTLFMERIWGTPGAVIITLLIVWTCFASVFNGLLGASRLPYNAAKDGLFFKPFAKLHPKHHFPNVSLLILGGVMAICCFFDLTTIINALMALTIVIQFMGQIVALTVLRKRRPDLKRPYKQWLYPLPSILAFIGWAFVFYSSGWSAIGLAVVWTLIGAIIYLFWARAHHDWPFHKPEIVETDKEL